jgi:hypothetical protein
MSIVMIALALTPGVARAGPTVVVLDFGGGDGPAARSALVSPLSRRYEVKDGAVLHQAAAKLGVVVARGSNLAKAAQRLGAVAVVGGAVGDGKLSIAVFSGESGEVVSTDRVRWRSPPGRPVLRRALMIILKGLRRCGPVGAGGGSKKRPQEMTPDADDEAAPPPVDEPDPPPVHEPDPAPAPEPEPAPAPEPSSVSLTPDFDSSGQPTVEETPPNLATVRAKGPPLVTTPAVVQKKTEESASERDPSSPRVVATVGFGGWSRSLEIHDPDTAYSPSPPTYSSNIAMALVLDLKARPLAFIRDRGFLAGAYFRLGYRTMLGLKSQNAVKDATGSEQVEALETSLWELCLEGGYDWKVLDRPLSPHLELGIGYGMMDFSIDWGAAAAGERRVPDASYRFMLGALGGRIPFSALIGAHARFDYRIVSSTGEIESAWYGPSSTGGINMLAGLDGTYSGFVARLEYSYTRYFYSFEEGLSRAQQCRTGGTCLQAAGGALDVLHGFTASVGYSF